MTVFAALAILSAGILATGAYAQLSVGGITDSGPTTSLDTTASSLTTSLGTTVSDLTTTLGTTASSLTTTLGTTASSLTTTLGTTVSSLTAPLNPTPIPPGIIPTTGPSLPNSTSTPPQTTVIPPSTNYTISRASSGLVASDSFTNYTASQQQLQSSHGYWFYGGDAPDEKAPYAVWRDTQGLHIGVQAPANGTYAGYYAVTPQTTATLYHVKVTAPVETIPSSVSLYENGMYVQNGTMDVNYVVCTSATSKIGTQWVVVAANGDVNGANTYTPFWWTAMTPTQPLSVDCTIITNGTNYLKVLLNNVPVYQSKSLKLNMSSNLITFMEPQSSYAGQLLNGTFQNFYATSGGNVTVTNNPPGASTVKLVQPTPSGDGNVLVSAPVDAAGRAVLYAENQPMPINAYVIVYDAKGNAMAKTSGPVGIYGGDSYSVSGSAASYTASSTNTLPPPGNLVATTISQSQIRLTWSAPQTTAVVTGYKIERLAGSSATWSVLVPNANPASTAYSDTGLAPGTTYAYRVYAVYGTQTSPSTDVASATTLASQYQVTVASQLDTGGALNGLFTVLYNSTGQAISTGFTPASFVLNTGAQYSAAVGNYATYAFDHWKDNGSTSDPRQVSITSDTTLTAVFKDTAVRLSPPSGPAGTLVTATGTTFSPGATIRLTFDGAALATTPATVTANSTGGFGATFQVPPAASSGAHTVTASDGTNTHSALFTAGSGSQSGNTATGGIALDNVQSTSGTTSPSNQMTISNFNAETSSSQLLLVGVSANSNNVESITFAGVPLARAVSHFTNNDAEFWYLANPHGTGDITVTMNGPTQAVVGAYSFSGVNQTVPILAHITRHNLAPSSPSISITTIHANDWVLDLPSIWGGVTLGSPTCAQQWNVNVPGQITGASSSAVVPSPATVTCSWAASSDNMWDDAAIEINAG